MATKQQKDAENLKKLTQERREIQSQINDGLRNQNNLTNQYATLLQAQFNTTKEVTDNIKDRVSVLNALAKSTDRTRTLDSRINDLQSKQKDIIKEKARINDKNEKFARGERVRARNKLKVDEEALRVRLRTLKAQKLATDSLAEADKAFGGIGSSIKGFLLNPLTAAVALIAAFNETQETIAKQFGGIGVKDFRKELAGASAEFVGLTLSGAEAQKSISDLANNFGISVPAARELSTNVGRIAVSTGMSVDESTKLVGLFTQTQGLTGQQAEDLLLGTRQLAKANNVAPDQVLSDIASDTELFARFTKDGGENLLRAAVQARKLGINISAVAKAADGLLDFQSSLNAEIEASVLLGRDINLQKARELSLTNDIEGLQKELVKQVGTEAQFNKLNRIQRDSLARAIGMSVSEIQKLVSRQKDQITLQGEINRLTAENEVPEDTITAVAKILADLKQTGMELAERIGPGLISVVEVLGAALGFLDKFIGLGNLAIGVMAAFAVKSLAAAGAQAALAYFKVAGGLGPVGAMMLAAAPVAIPLLVGISAAAISGMASAEEGGITTQDGVMQVHRQEAILPIEMLARFFKDAVAPIFGQNQKIIQQNDAQIAETRRTSGRIVDGLNEVA